jgi:transcriptional regulator with XRE-family HTH domain
MVARIKVGTNVIALQFLPKIGQSALQWDHPLRRNATSVNPHRNLRLPDRLSSQFGEFCGDGDLPARSVDRLLNSSDTHMQAHYNTASVIVNNTPSANAARQTWRMPRHAETTEFWRRLTAARSSHNPPLSMRQEDVARDAELSHQSAVTKWKTGKGVPSFETYRKLAIQANVTVDWLITGRGEMRPRPTIDPITQQVLTALDALNPTGKVEVLKAAITQQTLQHPAIAAQVREAQKAADKLSAPSSRKAG